MIRSAVRVALRVHMRSAAGVVAFVVLLLALGVAILLSFRLLGQQPAPTVNYGGYGFVGFGRSPAADTSSALRPGLSSLSSESRGMVVLVVLAGVLAVGGGVVGAMYGACSIAGEYERETLDLVLTTQMGVGGLTATKLVTTFLATVVLAVALAPVFSFLRVFSGVPPQNLAVAAGVVLGSLLCGSAIGIFFSATLHSTVAAFLSATLVTLLLFGGGAAAYLLLLRVSGDPPILAQLLLLPSPVAALLSSATAQLPGGDIVLLPALLHASPAHPVHIAGPWQLPLPFWTLTLSIDVVLAAVLSALSSRAIRRSLLS